MFLLGKTNSKRTYMTTYQTQTLMRRLENKAYLEKGEKHHLARLLNTSAQRIQWWYTRARAARRQAGLLGKCENCSTK